MAGTGQPKWWRSHRRLLIGSVITRGSVDQLRLKGGDEVVAVIKSIEVMIQKD